MTYQYNAVQGKTAVNKNIKNFQMTQSIART